MLTRIRLTAITLAILATVGAAAFVHMNNRRAEAAVQPPQTLSLATRPTPLVTYETPIAQQLGEETLTLIGYDWVVHLPEWRIEFLPREGSAAGYTWSHEQRIEIFVRESSTPESLARVLAHELGHAVDVSLNSPEERQQWLLQRGATETPWWPSSGAPDFQTGAGDFAETFAAWLVPDLEFRSIVGPPPTGDDIALVAALAGFSSGELKP